MDWLKAPELQGIAALIAIASAVWAVVRSIRLSRIPSATPLSAQPVQSPSDSPTHAAIGITIFMILGWVLISIPWMILASVLKASPSIVMSAPFFAIGACTALGVLISRSPLLGGFLGGGLALGTIALLAASASDEMQQTVSGLAWFVVFFIFQGVLSAVAGVVLVKIARFIRLPVPYL